MLFMLLARFSLFIFLMQNHSCTSSSKRYVAKNLFFYKEHILKTAFLPSIQLFNTPSPCQAQAITTPCQPYIYIYIYIYIDHRIKDNQPFLTPFNRMMLIRPVLEPLGHQQSHTWSHTLVVNDSSEVKHTNGW